MKSILAIQLKRIGDLILTLPALEALRRAYPKAKITLAIDSASAGLIPVIRSVDRVLVYKKKSLNVDTFRRLILKKYDATLDFTGTDRSLLLTGLSKADQRVAFRWAGRGKIRTASYTHLVDSSVRERHTVDHYLDLLSGIGIHGAQADLKIRLPKTAGEALQNHSVKSPYAVIHVGAARAEKYWKPERWAAVLDYCQGKKGVACLLIGGNSPMEKEAIEELRSQTKSAFFDFSGQLDLMASAALIEGSALFIGIDSGPSHLAAALKISQITLFGPTNPFHWRARHSRSVVLQGGKENPITRFEPHTRAGNLNDLSTPEVIHAINLLLPTPKTSPTP